MEALTRFLEYVGPIPDTDECLLWPGWRTAAGYGGFSLGPAKSRRSYYAHRVALAYKLGRPLEPGEEARHTCDNPPCYNPRHLIPGSHRDNMNDAAERSLMAHGEDHPHAKLRAEDARAIFTRARSEKLADIAADYGVSYVTVSDIARGVTWRRATADLGEPLLRRPGRPSRC